MNAVFGERAGPRGEWGGELVGETRGELAAVEHGDTEVLRVVITETGVNIWESNIQRPHDLIKFFSPYNIGADPYNIGACPDIVGAKKFDWL